MAPAVSLMVVLAALMVVVTAVSIDVEPAVGCALRRAKEIYVATRRQNGTRSKAAPVWFMFDGSALYFSTTAGSHKARRLRDGGPVYVSIGEPAGTEFEGRGELIDEPELIDRMAAHYRRKYWIAWLGFFVPSKNRVASGRTVIVKVTPVSSSRN